MRKFGLAIVAACVGVMWSATAWAVTTTITGQDENGTAIQDQVVHVDIVKKEEVGKPAPQRHPVQRIIVRIHHTGTGTLTYNDRTIDDRNNYVLLFYYTTGGKTYAGTQPLTLVGTVPVVFTPVPMLASGTPVPYTYFPGAPGTPYTGFAVSGFLSSNTGAQTINEFFRPTGAPTSTTEDTSTRVGGGLTMLYNFQVAPNVLIAPFASVNFPNYSNIHTFPGGGSFGKTEDFIITEGLQFGFPWRVEGANALFYIQLGAAETEAKFKVNFLRMPSSVDSRWLGGAMAGIGVDFQPDNWRIGNYPVSVFAQVNGIWWQVARFDAPAGSPFFNYEISQLWLNAMIGATIHFGAPPPR